MESNAGYHAPPYTTVALSEKEAAPFHELIHHHPYKTNGRISGGWYLIFRQTHMEVSWNRGTRNIINFYGIFHGFYPSINGVPRRSRFSVLDKPCEAKSPVRGLPCLLLHGYPWSPAWEWENRSLLLYTVYTHTMHAYIYIHTIYIHIHIHISTHTYILYIYTQSMYVM